MMARRMIVEMMLMGMAIADSYPSIIAAAVGSTVQYSSVAM